MVKLKRETLLYCFFKPVRKLPDPNGDLSTIILLYAITQVNKDVAMAVETTEGRKRKPYKKISDSLRSQIGRYTIENGNMTTMRCFIKKFDTSNRAFEYNHYKHHNALHKFSSVNIFASRDF